MAEPALTLLNPGPINVSARVREALATCPDLCHREPEYFELQDEVRRLLVDVFGIGADYEAALVSGSGTSGMEAMLASVVGTGVVVVDNGVYGDRLAQMAAAHRIPHRVVKCDWFHRPDEDDLEVALADPALDTLAIVHHETTTGLINDLEEIAARARRHGKRLIVDSVSGLAGEPFDFRVIRPDAVCSTANKCIHGLPGVSFVFVRKGTPLERRSLYLDLGLALAKQRASDTPFTPAIQVMAAFAEALRELGEETIAARQATYKARSDTIRSTLETLGLELMLPPALRSRTITSARLPAGLDYPTLHDRMKERGFVIYAGQGKLSEVAFRIANMGVWPEGRLDDLVAALREVLA